MRFVSTYLVVILLICPVIVTPVHAGTGNILILGDSLSAAYGIPVERGWVSLLQQRLHERGHHTRIINASISGETTAGALTRLPAILERTDPDIALIELGANDGLRGFPPATIRDNLSAIITQLKQNDSRVILVQMHLPPNYGPAYNARFDEIYTTLSARHEVALAPFILRNMFDNARLMQEDGLHPKAVAQPMILDHIWPVLEPMLSSLAMGP